MTNITKMWIFAAFAAIYIDGTTTIGAVVASIIWIFAAFIYLIDLVHSSAKGQK